MADLVATLEALGTFETLIKFIKVGGLYDMLTTEGDFTIFAPNDDAFRELSANQMKYLEDREHYLMEIVLHFTVEWSVTSKELQMAKKLRTLGEDDIVVKPKKKKILIQDAEIIKADIPADNGIIHVVDKVFLPEDILGFLQ